MTASTPPKAELRPLLTAPQAAELLGISTRTLSRMKLEGSIGFVTLGRRIVRYRQQDIERLLKRVARNQ